MAVRPGRRAARLALVARAREEHATPGGRCQYGGYPVYFLVSTDSPAHHTQHLETALRIIREHELTNVGNVGEVDLVRLLRVGIPVELEGGRRLFVGIVPAESPLVGTTIARTGRRIAGVETNIIAILRQDHLIVPHADTVFQPRDGLVLVAADDALAPLGMALELW